MTRFKQELFGIKRSGCFWYLVSPSKMSVLVNRQSSLSPASARSKSIPAALFGGDMPENYTRFPSVTPVKHIQQETPGPCTSRPALRNILNSPSPRTPSTPKKAVHTLTRSPSRSPTLPPGPAAADAADKKKPATKRRKFTGMDLVQIARAVNEVNPWVAVHGEKGKAWEKVNALLIKTEFRHKLNGEGIRQKAEGLVGYRKVNI